jgi:hypothetical protein
LADVGETAQFLAGKVLTLNNEARDRFLDWLYEDLAAALSLLIRRTRGDHSPDKYAERFPKVDPSADSGMNSMELFSRWVEERKPAYGTIESWTYVFLTRNARVAAQALSRKMKRGSGRGG